MQMRWSLAILSFISIINVAISVPIPGGPKDSSDKYRKNAEDAPYGFTATPGGSNVQRFHEQGPRAPRPGEDADHLLEVQTLHHALNDQGHPFHTLPMHHQSGIRQIVNDPSNMAFVPAGMNRAKGQAVRRGHQGQQITTHNPLRDAYTRATIPNAQHTAHRLDNYLTQAGYRGNVAETHARSMHGGGLATPGRPLPQNTPAHGQGGPSNLAHHMSNLRLNTPPGTPTPHGHGGPHTPPHHSSPTTPHAPSRHAHGVPHHEEGTPSRVGPPSTPAHQTGPHPDAHHLGTHAPSRHSVVQHPGLRRSNSLPASGPATRSMIAHHPEGHTHAHSPAHHEAHHDPPSPSPHGHGHDHGKGKGKARGG